MDDNENIEIITDIMILAWECEQAMKEEFEANLERQPGWTCCP